MSTSKQARILQSINDFFAVECSRQNRSHALAADVSCSCLKAIFAFRHIETVINRIIRQATALIDLPSCGLASFLATLEGLEPRWQLISVLEAAIRASKLAAITSTKSSTVGKHWGVLRSQSA